MRTRCWALLVTCVMFGSNAIAEDLLANREVLAMFSQVLRLGWLGFRDEETAAFIIRASDGSVQCMLWPPTNEFHSATYKPSAPPGVIAIVHTHPIHSPKPSARDRFVAKKHAIPIYAITLYSIYEADSSGQMIAHVEGHRWLIDDAPNSCAHSVRELETTRNARRSICLPSADDLVAGIDDASMRCGF